MDWSDYIPTLLKVPYNFYKNRKLIQKWWIKLLAHIDIGKTDIVVLGKANVGKTMLAEHMHGNALMLNFSTPDISTLYVFKLKCTTST